MRCNALLETYSVDAENVFRALGVDNTVFEGLSIEMKPVGGKIRVKVGAEKPETLLSTLDDIIRCQIVAEEAIKKIT